MVVDCSFGWHIIIESLSAKSLIMVIRSGQVIVVLATLMIVLGGSNHSGRLMSYQKTRGICQRVEGRPEQQTK